MLNATQVKTAKIGLQKSAWGLCMIAMVLSMVMGLAACGSKNDGNTSALPPGVVQPVIPSQACLPNQIYTTTHGCLYQQSCQNGYGWVPGEGRCVPGTIANGVGGTNFFTSLTIENRATFEMFLQGNRLCDPYVIGINLGSASCKNYSHSGYLIMQFPGLLANGTLPPQSYLWIGAGSRHPNQYNTEWVTGGAVQVLSMVTTNSSFQSGFTGIPATGGIPGGFRFVVNNGLPGSSYQFNVELVYNGAVFARGVLTRY